jgi:hypothetical protein
MATVMAGFLSPWLLGWISELTQPTHYPVARRELDLCIFFSWCVGSSERETWPLRVAGSLPLAVGVDRDYPPDTNFRGSG